MARTAGITIERSRTGRPTFIRIDLRKNADVIPVLQEKGIEIEQPVKWTAKMKESFTQAKKGEISEINMDDFRNT